MGVASRGTGGTSCGAGGQGVGKAPRDQVCAASARIRCEGAQCTRGADDARGALWLEAPKVGAVCGGSFAHAHRRGGAHTVCGAHRRLRLRERVGVHDRRRKALAIGRWGAAGAGSGSGFTTSAGAAAGASTAGGATAAPTAAAGRPSLCAQTRKLRT